MMNFFEDKTVKYIKKINGNNDDKELKGGVHYWV